MSAARHVSLTHEGDVLLVVLHGEVGSLGHAVALHDVASEIHDSPLSLAVVDFTETSYFGSSMLETLLSISRHCEERGGRLALCNVSDLGREILRLSKFDTLWPIFSSREEAVAAVRD